eukprot:3421701-Pyramimonas_sp.AAC.1
MTGSASRRSTGIGLRSTPPPWAPFALGDTIEGELVNAFGRCCMSSGCSCRPRSGLTPPRSMARLAGAV